MVLFVEIGYNKTKLEDAKFFLYEFTGHHIFTEESLLVYSELNKTEVQLSIKLPESYHKTSETRVYPKHPQHIRALIHFLLNNVWPEPTETLTTVYDYPFFTSTDHFPFN